MLKQPTILKVSLIWCVALLFSYPASAQHVQTKDCGKQYDANGNLLPEQDKSKWCKGSRKKRRKRIARIRKRKEKAEKS